MPISISFFTPRRLKKNGIATMKTISDIWPKVMVKAGIGHPLGLVEEEVGEVVIEGERDGDQQRADDQHGEGAILHQRQGVEAEHVADRDLLARRLGRRGGQRERVEAEQQRGTGADLHGHGARIRCRGSQGLRILPMSRPAVIQPMVPSTRMPGNCVPGILHLVKRDGVHQREGRHVERAVGQHRPEEGPGRGHGRREVEGPAPARCRTPSTFCAEKKRSAIMPTKKGAMTAPQLVVL